MGTKIEHTCKTCGKKADEASRKLYEAFHFAVISLTCGHSYTEPIARTQPWEDIETQFGAKHRLFPYQGLGYEFARESGFRCIIGDEQGLGKTWQGLACIKLHSDILTPTLIICKASLKIQLMRETLRLLGPDYLPQIILSGKDKPNSMFPIVIVTYDMLWRITKEKNKAYDSAIDSLRKELGLGEFDAIPEEREHELPSLDNPFTAFNFKCVILDECQQIKNPNSKRAGQVREICRTIPHVLALSGSPIENNAGEYFTVLNIVKPERFRTYKGYVENYCDWYWNGRGYKIGGLRDVEWFRAQTNDFIIRRKQKDVLPDLPDLQRNFVNCEFASQKMEKDYQEMAEDFADFFYEEEGSQDYQQGLLARMAKMRHKVGINKVPFVTEQVLQHVLDTPVDRKIVIFVHHQDVGSMLHANLSKEFQKLRETGSDINNPLTFTSDLNGQQRDSLLSSFKDIDANRVLIGSSLAMAEGLNLQFCSDCIIMERQWNPKKEEQMERRFIRPGGAKISVVNAGYVLVAGTIDEYLTELIEIKRANTDQTLDGIEYDFNEANLMKELAAILAQKGSKKWRLK